MRQNVFVSGNSPIDSPLTFKERHHFPLDGVLETVAAILTQKRKICDFSTSSYKTVEFQLHLASSLKIKQLKHLKNIFGL